MHECLEYLLDHFKWVKKLTSCIIIARKLGELPLWNAYSIYGVYADMFVIVCAVTK